MVFKSGLNLFFGGVAKMTGEHIFMHSSVRKRARDQRVDIDQAGHFGGL